MSWDGSPVPTDDPEPEKPETPEEPEEPEEPEFPVPSTSNIISLNPPSFSVSWDGPQPPKTSKKPGHPKPPRPTHKTKSKKTSTKGYVTASVSWGKAQDEALSTPTNIISLNPPTYSVSWNGPKPPKTTKKPRPPKPSQKTSTKGHVSASISWAKRQDVSYSISWDGPQPPLPTKKPWPWWPPAWTSTNGYVSASVSWNKRQDEEDPEPTDFPDFPDFPEDPEFPEFPEEPNNPITQPAPPAFTPPNTIGIQPPKVSFSWGKRQEDEPLPTDFPDFPEDPEFPEFPEEPNNPITQPAPPVFTPPNTIGIQPPKVSFSWGKRQDEPEPTDFPDFPEDPEFPEFPEEPNNSITQPAPPAFTPPNTIGIQPPKVSFSWGKREVAATVPSKTVGKPTKSTKSPNPPKSTTKAWISWGKRQDEDPVPTEISGPSAPPPSDQITIVPPTASISWGKREPEPQAPTYGLGFPTFSWGFPPALPSSAHVSWGKREDDEKKTRHPTTFQTHKSRPHPTVTSKPVPIPSSCPTVTKTIVPPCVPPTCPRGLVGCKVGEAKVLEIEKTIVTITTVAKPTLKPTPTKSVCTTSTVLVNIGCPTWTCVPGGQCAQMA